MIPANFAGALPFLATPDPRPVEWEVPAMASMRPLPTNVTLHHATLHGGETCVAQNLEQMLSLSQNGYGYVCVCVHSLGSSHFGSSDLVSESFWQKLFWRFKQRNAS